MTSQLRLLTEPSSGPAVEAPTSWRIDETTKAVGRSGVALARQALRQARRPGLDHDEQQRLGSRRGHAA